MIELTSLAVPAMPLEMAFPRDAPAPEGADFALIEAAFAEEALDPEVAPPTGDPAGEEVAAPHPAFTEDVSWTLVADSASDSAVAPDPLVVWLDAQTGICASLASEPTIDVRMVGLEAPQPLKARDAGPDAALLSVAPATSGVAQNTSALAQASADASAARHGEAQPLARPVTGAVAEPVAAKVEPGPANTIPAAQTAEPAKSDGAVKAEGPQLLAASVAVNGRVEARVEPLGLPKAATEPKEFSLDPSRMPLTNTDAEAPVAEEAPPGPIMKAAPDSQIAERVVPLVDRPNLAEKAPGATALAERDQPATRSPVETMRPLEASVAPAKPAPALAAVPTGMEGLQDPAPRQDMPLVEAAPSWREANAAGQPVARQIVAALAPPPAIGGMRVTTAEGVTEIALSPEELGRVQISVSGQDKPLIVITAERPETLELLRRNADLLAAELREAGLEGGALSFRDGPPPEPHRLLRETARDGTEAAAIPAIPLAIAQEAGRLAAQRRIDIRL